MNLLELKHDFLSGKTSKTDYLNQMFAEHERLFEYSWLLEKSDVEKIEITPNHVCVRLKPFGLTFLLSKGEKRIAPIEILNLGTYESHEIQMMIRVIQDNWNILDIGANVGFHALTLSCAFPHAGIFAVEPVPDTFEQLRRHIEMNSVTNVFAFNFGFGRKRREVSFFRSSEGSVNVSMANVKGEKEARQIRAQVLPIDEFVTERKLSIQFVKCDVEGAEFEVLKSGSEMIDRDKPVIFAEMLRKWSAQFHYHPNDMIEWFKGKGYQCFSISEKKLRPFARMDELTVETNFFFIHSKTHSQLLERLLR